MALEITSPSFQHGGEIPMVHTCEGEDRSPALAWTGVPEGTRSFVLIVEDPDAPDPAAPKRVWAHWLLYNLPPATAGLPEGVRSAGLPRGTREGKNDWGRTGYGGPCPPIGRHRYFHKLWALDIELPELSQPDRRELLEVLSRHRGNVLAQAELVGTYQKRRR